MTKVKTGQLFVINKLIILFQVPDTVARVNKTNQIQYKLNRKKDGGDLHNKFTM